jgi:hypothetical protein
MSNDQYTKIKSQGSPYDSLIQSAAETHGVSYDLLHKQLFIESSFNPNAKSPTGPRGIGQFTKETGKAYGLVTDEDFFDPVKSIDAAARHMKDNLKIAGGDELKALLAYNQGAGKLGRPQLAAYDRGDLSGVSEEGRNYMAKLADVAQSGKRDELSAFLASTGDGSPRASAVTPGDIPFKGSSMSMRGADVPEKATPFAEELYRATGSTEDKDGPSFFEGTGKAIKGELALSPFGVAIRAAIENKDFDFSEALSLMGDTRNDPFNGGKLTAWTDEDFDLLRSSTLDPQFYDVVLRGSRENFDNNLRLALENQQIEKELRKQGFGAQLSGGLVGQVGDPWTYVAPGRGAAASLGSRLAGGSLVNAPLAGLSEHDSAKASGREEHLLLAIAGGAAFGGMINGMLGARPGRNSWDLNEPASAMEPEDFLSILNRNPSDIAGSTIRLENREAARLAGVDEDPTRMPFRAGEDVIKEDAAVPYMDVPFDPDAARLADGTIISGGSPLNPKTLKSFREVDPEPVRANAGLRLGGISEIGLVLGRSEDQEIRGIAGDLFRSPTGYQDGSSGKFGATASDIVERLRSQDNVAHSEFRGALDEALKDPFWRAQRTSSAAKEEAISRKVVEAMEDPAGNHTLNPAEKKLLSALKKHMEQKWEFIENPGQFGNPNAKSLLAETRHQGSYFPQRYSTHAKHLVTQKLGGADELQEAIASSWLASYAKRPHVKARVDKMIEEKLQAEGIAKATPEQINQAVRKYAKSKAFGISHTDQFNRSSIIEEQLKDGAGVENNAYLEARNLFDSDVKVNLPDGTMFSVNDLREFDVMRVVPQYDRRVNGDIALMGGTGKSTEELKALALKIKQRATRGDNTTEADALLDALKLFTGRSRRDKPEDAYETAMRSLMDVGFVTKNAYMGIQNFTEAASLIVKGHTKMLLKGVPVLKKLTTAGTKLKPDDIRQVHGMVFGKELDDLIRPSRMDIVDRLRERHGEFWSQTVGTTKFATGWAAHHSPFTWFLRETSNYIMDAGRQGVIVDLADNVLNGTRSSLFSDVRLRSASISPEQMKGIEDLIKSHFKRDSSGKWSLVNPEALAADTRSMDLWRLGDAVADETILRPHKVSSQMHEQQSAYWAAALQFKMFVLRSINSRVMRGWWESTQGGKEQALDQVFKSIVSVGLATGFYAAQAHLKSFGMSERERGDYLEKALNPNMLAYAAMSRSSHVGAPLGAAGFVMAPFGVDMAAAVRTSILPRQDQKERGDQPIKYGALRSSDVQDFGSRLLEQVPAAQVVANGFQGVNSAVGLTADRRGMDAQGYRTALWNALRHFVPNDPASQNIMLRVAEFNGVDRAR